MAKKQTRRSISVSRTTYERLKAFCETNHISMSQLVETRVNDFLGNDFVAPGAPAMAPNATIATSAVSASSGLIAAARPMPPRPMASAHARPVETRPMVPARAADAPSPPTTPSHPAPMTSAAARYAVEPPPPIIKPRQETAAPKPAEKRPEQIFTF
jgi:hypothetical protein